MVALGGQWYQLFTNRYGHSSAVLLLSSPSAGPLSKVTPGHATHPSVSGTVPQRSFLSCRKHAAFFPLLYLAGQVGVT